MERNIQEKVRVARTELRNNLNWKKLRTNNKSEIPLIHHVTRGHVTSLAITVLGYQTILTGQMWSRGPAEGLRLEKQKINRLLAAITATLARFIAT